MDVWKGSSFAPLCHEKAYLVFVDANHGLSKVLRELGDQRGVLVVGDGLVLPGGESTVQMKLLRELGMYDGLKALIDSGKPVLGTCAGLILLASSVEGQSALGFGTMPVTVRRNAYGRQLGSFRTVAPFKGVGDVPMTFIRAPYVTEVGPGVEVLSKVDGNVVAVKYGNQYGLSFHPELDEGTWVYKLVFNL